MGFNFGFGDTSTYTRFEGGGSELLPYEGLFEVEIDSVTEGKSKIGNFTIELGMIVKDEDARGKRLMKSQAVTGKRKDGKDNVVQLIAILESVWSADGLSDEEIQQKVLALSNQSTSSDQLTADLKGRSAYVEVTSRSYVNDSGSTVWTSDIRNFKLRQHVEDARGVNAHRRPLNAKAQAFLDGHRGGVAATATATTSAPAANASDIV